MRADATVSIADQVRAKEAELDQVRQAMAANFDRAAGTSRMRGKQHGIRVDAQIRRGAQLGAAVERLGRELNGLRDQAARPELQPVDLSNLSGARFIRTKFGWYEVVKVNRATVKVLTAPGMDDLIKVGKILEIR
ncbi:hypothetical protein AB0B94_30965 [Micromonospora sp. NPDC048986]|uniref:hypothetical protein n=1 Tax=Micromonospora sp. NPDC048986 TaxID=3155644 RepID=UPI00340A25CF